MDALLLAGAALLFGGKLGKKRGSETIADPVIDGARLVSRANVQQAGAWVPRFMAVGAPTALAEAYARWAGIESGGNPRAVSKLGERGLFQVSEQEALKEKPPALTWSEWDAMTRRETTPEFDARIAMRIADWEWGRARRHLTNPGLTPADVVWYAKLYHQRPVDVRDGALHGGALTMARELAVRWRNDANKMHRLRAANVVAFNNAKP